MGMSAWTYAQHENGTRGFKAEAPRYAKKFKVGLEWLLTGKGAPHSTPEAELVGYIGAGGEVFPIDDHAQGAGLEPVEAPSGAEGSVALRIRGNSMHPLQDGWLIFYRREVDGVDPSLVGRLCVVKLTNGAMMLKTLRHGRKKGRWNLESYNEPMREDQKLEWASKVLFIKQD